MAPRSHLQQLLPRMLKAVQCVSSPWPSPNCQENILKISASVVRRWLRSIELPVKCSVMVWLWIVWPVFSAAVCKTEVGEQGTDQISKVANSQTPEVFSQCWGWLLLHHLKPLLVRIWEFFLTHLILFQTHYLYSHCWAVALLMVSWNDKYIAKKVAYHPFSLDTINFMHSPVINNENKWSKYYTEHLRCQKLPQIPTSKMSGLKHTVATFLNSS